MGRAPSQGGFAPWSWKPFRPSFWMPKRSSKFASPNFANTLNPRYLWYISQKTEGIVHGGMDNKKAVWNCSVCDVRSKSAQIVAPNVYWETPLNYNNYTHPLTPPPVKTHRILHQSPEQPLAKVGWTCPPQSTPWRLATPLTPANIRINLD